MDQHDNLLGYRHALIRQVIERFKTAQPQSEMNPVVELLLFPCTTPSLRSARGIASQGEVRPSMPVDTVHGAPLSEEEMVKLSKLKAVKELRLEEYIHIAVESPIGGFPHLFNFGTDGHVAKLFPHSAESARQIPLNRRLFVSPNQGCSPFMDASIPFQEVGDGRGGRIGKVNGHPERLFALVMTRNVAVRAGMLHPDWHHYDESFRGGDGNADWDHGPPISETEDEFSQRFGLKEWAWGYLEVPVV